MSTKYRREEVLGCYVVLSVAKALKRKDFLDKFEGISKRFTQDGNKVNIGEMRSFLIKSLASGSLDDAWFDALEEIFDSPVVKLVQLFNKNSSKQIEEFTTKSSSERNCTFLQKHADKIKEMCEEGSVEFVDIVYHLCEDMLPKLKRGEQRGGSGGEGENGGGGGGGGGDGDDNDDDDDEAAVPGVISYPPSVAAAAAAAATAAAIIPPLGFNEAAYDPDPYSILGWNPDRLQAAWQAGIVYCDFDHLFGVPLSAGIGACNFACVSLCFPESVIPQLTMVQSAAILYPSVFACGLCCCCLGNYLNVVFTTLPTRPAHGEVIEMYVLPGAFDGEAEIHDTPVVIHGGERVIEALQAAIYVGNMPEGPVPEGPVPEGSMPGSSMPGSSMPGGSSSKTLYTNNRKTKRKQHKRRQRKHTHHKKKRSSNRKRRTKRM
jgi:hypothetical protein